MELTLTLPDPVAREAQAAGLLTPQAIEAMLKRELRRKAGQQFAESATSLGAVDLPPLTEDEIQAEIDAYRAERRARRP